MSIVQEIRSLVRKGDYDQAQALIAFTVDESGFDPPTGVFELLDECVPHSAMAKMQAATLYGMGIRPEPEEGACERMLREVEEGDNGQVSLMAAMVLGNILCTRDSLEEGSAYFRKAAEASFPDAWFAYAEARMHLAGMDSPEMQKVFSEIFSAHEAGDVTATSALGRLMVDHELEADGIDPFLLLDEAAARGDSEAADYLDGTFEEEDEEDEEDDDGTPLVPPADILPYVVVPDGMKRPRLVRDALVRETGMPQDLAETMTARFHGFAHWRQMKDATEDQDRQKGPFDEDCPAAAFNDRVAVQAEIAAAFGFGDETVGEAVVSLLSPTARSGKPSLRRLEGKLANRMFDVSDRKLRKGLEHVMEMVGFSGDPSDFSSALRTALPLAASPMLEKLRQFGWTIEKVTPAPDRDGSKVAVATSAGGEEVDVYASVVSFAIGDLGDEHVEALQEEIAARKRKAVLLFTRCRVYPVDGRKGVLQGGRAFDGLEWWDFALKPGEGVDGAFNQKGLLSKPVDPSFLERYAYDGAMNDCVLLDLGARGAKDTEMGTVRLIGTDDGWKSPISGVLGEAWDQMKEMRRMFGPLR